MAHPYNEHRASKVEKERVKHLCRGGYASGGSVGDSNLAQRSKMVKSEEKNNRIGNLGLPEKARSDRVKRAKGGRVKHKGGHKTNVNVIVAPSGGDKGPMAGLGPKPPIGMAPPMPPTPGAMPPPPPMAAKPPMPMPPPGAGAPGAMPMPMRKKGGRVNNFEGSKKDLEQDKKLAKKHGMSFDKWEKSPLDRKHDKQQSMKGLRRGGSTHDAADAEQSHPRVGRTEAGGRTLRGAVSNTKTGPKTDQKLTIRQAARDIHRERADGGKIPMPKPRPQGKGPDASDLYAPKDLKRLSDQNRAKGGKVVAGADERGKTGIGFRLPVQHSGNKDDTQNIGRKPVVTRATGGPIFSDGKMGSGMGPDLGAGSKGGLGRLKKAERAAKHHFG